MSTTVATLTADALFALRDDAKRHVLVDGVHQVMNPPGYEHGVVAMRIGYLLHDHVRRSGCGGQVTAAETGFLIGRDPDTVLAPDSAYVAVDRLQALGTTERYWPEAPALAAEVISSNDRFGDVEEKAFRWLEAGAIAVLLVDPRRRTATVYRARDDVRAYEPGAEVDLSDAVPGFRLSLAELFA